MDVESSLEVSLDQYSLNVLQKRQREELGISIHHCREGHRGVGYAKVKAEDRKRGTRRELKARAFCWEVHWREIPMVDSQEDFSQQRCLHVFAVIWP